MKKALWAALMLLSFSTMAVGPEKEVMDIVKQLFNGMRAGDSTLVRNVFYTDARSITISEKDGKPDFRIGSVDRFVEAVGTPHDKVWDEPIWDTDVKIDGNFAQVWTKYAFYLGDQFHHCGVDAIQLFKTENGWRIFQLTDTRQVEDCELPPK